MKEAMELLVKAQKLLEKEYDGEVHMGIYLLNAFESEHEQFAEEAGKALGTEMSLEQYNDEAWFRAESENGRIEVIARIS